MSPLLKRLLYFFGSGLTLLSLLFVARRLSEHAGEIDITHLSTASIIALIGLAIVYSLLNLLLALAWRYLLRYQDIDVIPLWAIWSYGVSQLAKYMPGNIFHLAGRQAIGIAGGLPGWSVARSILWEHGLLAVTAIPFIILTSPLLLDERLALPVSLVIFGGSIGLLIWFVNRRFSRDVGHAMFLHTLFLFVSGMIFASIIILTTASMMTLGAFLGICGAYVIAWLAGLVTPGAPAGIGVREVILYAFLSPIISQSDLLMVIVIGRMITVSGDLLYFGGCSALVTLHPAIRQINPEKI